MGPVFDPSGRSEVETPAATAFVRGTDLRISQPPSTPTGARRFLFQNLSTPPGGSPVEVGGGPAGAPAAAPDQGTIP